MNGAHDVGGMQTFGRVDPHDDGRPFHAPWEGRTFAISLILPAQGVFNTNEFRDRRERIPPADYYRRSYFDLWLTSMETLVVEKGLVTREELERRAAAAAPSSAAPAAAPDPLARRMLDQVHHGSDRQPPGPAPRFRPGDRVRARNVHPEGHIRMPRYVRGRPGVVDLSHGSYELPDESARGVSKPEPLYTVRFDAIDLWGEQARAGDGVRVDLWESYLEPAGEVP